jgi:hypothetical protein
LFLEKSGKGNFEFDQIGDLEAWRNRGEAIKGTILANKVTGSEWNFAVGKPAAFLEKLEVIS